MNSPFDNLTFVLGDGTSCEIDSDGAVKLPEGYVFKRGETCWLAPRGSNYWVATPAYIGLNLEWRRYSVPENTVSLKLWKSED